MARFVFALSAAAWMATVVSAVDHSVAGGALAPAVRPAAVRAGDAPQASQDAASPRALLDRYCVTCHNQRLKTGGLSLDTVDPSNLAEHADVWEKVVRKLRAGTMPPVGRPRPEKPVAASLVSSLEAGLDRAAAAKPNPGRAPLHRLNRTEYANAIRDMLALDVDVRDPAARRRHRRARLRQRRRGADRLAGADGTVPVCRAQDRPARSRVPDRSRRGVVSAAEDAHPGRSAQRGSAVRIARRRRGAPLLPRGRRVQDQGQAEVEPLRLHPRPGTAAGSRRAARWRAREALHRRRPIGSESAAAQLLGRDARQHDLRDLRT